MPPSTRWTEPAAALTSTPNCDAGDRGESPVIVYQANKTRFIEEVGDGGIEYLIAHQYLKKTGR